MFWWVLCLECTWPFRVESEGLMRCTRCGRRWVVKLEHINGHMEPVLEDECTSKKKKS